VWLVMSCAGAGFAQNLGDVARQERERKKEQAPVATYVYTNDDLKRPHILVPEDQERVLAARRIAADPTVQVSQAVGAVVAPALPDLVFPSSAGPAVAETALPAPAVPAPVSTPTLSAPALPNLASAVPVEGVTVRPESSLQANSPRAASATNRAPSHELFVRASEKKIVRARAAGNSTSRSGYSRPQARRAILEREPVSLRADGLVTVERGDSLWKLAKRYLGKGARWRELAILNTQISNADVIHVGEWVRLPGGDVPTDRQIAAAHAHGSEKMKGAQASAVTPAPAAGAFVQLASQQRFEP